jgi:hypothetical protein
MATFLTPAVTSAVPSWTDAQTVVGTVAAPEYPGPITTDHAGGPEPYAPGSPAGPIPGVSPSIGFFEMPPYFGDIPGEIGDTSALLGHEAPQATFDSNAGEPFAGGSGPVADTHEFDTGGTYRTQHVIQPKAGSWWRRTLTGETYNNTDTYDSTGKVISTDNGRQDFDQYQGHNADASDPRWIPYSERPIYLNVAHEPVPFGEDSPGVYTPQGQLSPVGPQFWTDTSNIYETPPDPAVSTANQQTAQTSAVGFWG